MNGSLFDQLERGPFYLSFIVWRWSECGSGFRRGLTPWALVDVLAGDVVGEMALHVLIRRTPDRWARDDDFWVRWSSMLAELKPLRNGAPFEPFWRRADDMLEEGEFFIRKAIGWVLRETSKKRPMRSSIGSRHGPIAPQG